MGYSARGHKVSDTPERLTLTPLSWSSGSQNWSLTFLRSLSEPLSPLDQLPSSGIIWLHVYTDGCQVQPFIVHAC